MIALLLAVSICGATGCSDKTSSNEITSSPIDHTGTTGESTPETTETQTVGNDTEAKNTTSDTEADTEPSGTGCAHHNYETTITSPATCTNDGSKIMTCSTCGYSTSEAIPSPGHSFSNKQCTVCLEWQVSEGLSFSLNSDSASYSVSGIGSCSDKILVIPSTYKSLPVTGITSLAFQDNTSIKTVVIPESVTSVGNKAFSGCVSLTTFTVNYEIGALQAAIENAFSSPSFLFNDDYSSIFSLPSAQSKSNSKEDSKDEVPDGIGEWAFSNCSSLTSLTIPNGTKRIADRGFYNCASLANIVIPKSVTSIAGGAFYGTEYYNNRANWTDDALYLDGWLLVCKETVAGAYTIKPGTIGIAEGAVVLCSSLEKITLPDSVMHFGKPSVCDSITSIAVDNNNPVYKSIDGNLYSKDGKTLIQYAIGTQNESFVIPDGVRSIGDYAFDGCTSLTTLTIPDSLESVGDWAFSGCSSISSVYITDIVAWCNIDFYGATSNPCSPYPDAGDTEGSFVKTNLYLNGEMLVDLVIPDSVKDIRNYTFTCCASLKTVVLPDGIKSIGDGAFRRCKFLTDITIPDSVKTIGEWAFMDCTSLTQYIIPSSITDIGEMAFAGWTNLTTIIIPDSVKSIGGGAFMDCTSLTTVIMGNGVKTIGDGAFSRCSALTHITIPDSVTSIGVQAFSSCTSLTTVIIGNGVKSIGESAFVSCHALNNVTIGNGLETIETGAFSDCRSLKTIILPQSLKNIGNSAFYCCSALTAIVIPDSVKSIGDEVFFDCSRLTTVTIGRGVTSIGYRAFHDCVALASITVDENNNSYKSIDGDLYTKDGKTLIYDSPATILPIPEGETTIADNAFVSRTDLTSIVIPDGVTSIGNFAFSGCSALTTIIIPDGVTSIGESAFSSCSALTTIVIPDSVTSIGNNAFAGCSALTTIVIPDGVTSIGAAAFWGCNSLTRVVIPDSVTSIGWSVFGGCRSLSYIYCEADCQPAGWINGWSSGSDATIYWSYKYN